MSTVIGRHMPPEPRVSIAHCKTVTQIQFETPQDFLKYVRENFELRDQILRGEWQWITQDVQGGH